MMTRDRHCLLWLVDDCQIKLIENVPFCIALNLGAAAAQKGMDGLSIVSIEHEQSYDAISWDQYQRRHKYKNEGLL